MDTLGFDADGAARIQRHRPPNDCQSIRIEAEKYLEASENP